MEQLNNNINDNEEIKNKIELMIKYLHINDIFKFGAGIYKLA